jgi:hypothetical protein
MACIHPFHAIEIRGKYPICTDCGKELPSIPRSFTWQHPPEAGLIRSLILHFGYIIDDYEEDPADGVIRIELERGVGRYELEVGEHSTTLHLLNLEGVRGQAWTYSHTQEWTYALSRVLVIAGRSV